MSLEVEQLGYSWPGQSPVFEKLSFKLARGGRLAILGGNGAGKSTLVRSLAGYLAVNGTVHWKGRSWQARSRAEHAATVQYVGQRPHLHISGRGHTIREEIAFGPENLGLPTAIIRQRVQEAMDLLGLTDLSERDCRRLSGGETQRTALAGALAMRPELLILDEPMTDLDDDSRDALTCHFRDLPWEMTLIVTDIAPQAWMQDLISDALVLGNGGVHGPFDRSIFLNALQDPGLVLADDQQEVPRKKGAADQHTSAGITRAPRLTGKAEWQPADGVYAEGLAFGYSGQPLLFQGLDLLVPPGSVLAVMGRNGRGKTSLMRLLGALERPAEGRIVLAGADLARTAPQTLARLIGMVAQSSDRHFLRRTVVEEVAFGPRLIGMGDYRAKARAALGRLGIDDLAERHPLDLNAGQKRLVALAVAIVHGPRLLLLDEVQRGLDRVHLARVEAVIAEESARGASIVLVTHDRAFAERTASAALLFADDGVRLVDGFRGLPTAPGH